MTIWFLQGGSKRTRPSIIRANLRIWSKIRIYLGWSKFVSAYVERDKKNFKKFDFCTCPSAEMSARGAEDRSQKPGVRKKLGHEETKTQGDTSLRGHKFQ